MEKDETSAKLREASYDLSEALRKLRGVCVHSSLVSDSHKRTIASLAVDTAALASYAEAIADAVDEGAA